MKTLLRALVVTAVASASYYAGEVTRPAPFKASASAATGPLRLTGHDALGRTKAASAVYNTFSYSGGTLVIDYTSDQYLCSGFGG